MDAAITVSDRIDPAEITAITLRCPPLVPELMGTLHPADGLRSRFSARHGTAVGLLFGRAGLAEFSDEVATAPEVARLRALITLDPDPAVARDAAVLRIETRSAARAALAGRAGCRLTSGQNSSHSRRPLRLGPLSAGRVFPGRSHRSGRTCRRNGLPL